MTFLLNSSFSTSNKIVKYVIMRSLIHKTYKYFCEIRYYIQIFHLMRVTLIILEVLMKSVVNATSRYNVARAFYIYLYILDKYRTVTKYRFNKVCHLC